MKSPDLYLPIADSHSAELHTTTAADAPNLLEPLLVEGHDQFLPLITQYLSTGVSSHDLDSLMYTNKQMFKLVLIVLYRKVAANLERNKHYIDETIGLICAILSVSQKSFRSLYLGPFMLKEVSIAPDKIEIQSGEARFIQSLTNLDTKRELENKLMELWHYFEMPKELESILAIIDPRKDKNRPCPKIEYYTCRSEAALRQRCLDSGTGVSPNIEAQSLLRPKLTKIKLMRRALVDPLDILPKRKIAWDLAKLDSNKRKNRILLTHLSKAHGFWQTAEEPSIFCLKSISTNKDRGIHSRVSYDAGELNLLQYLALEKNKGEALFALLAVTPPHVQLSLTVLSGNPKSGDVLDDFAAAFPTKFKLINRIFDIQKMHATTIDMKKAVEQQKYERYRQWFSKILADKRTISVMRDFFRFAPESLKSDSRVIALIKNHIRHLGAKKASDLFFMMKGGYTPTGLDSHCKNVISGNLTACCLLEEKYFNGHRFSEMFLEAIWGTHKSILRDLTIEHYCNALRWGYSWDMMKGIPLKPSTLTRLANFVTFNKLVMERDNAAVEVNKAIEALEKTQSTYLSSKQRLSKFLSRVNSRKRTKATEGYYAKKRSRPNNLPQTRMIGHPLPTAAAAAVGRYNREPLGRYLSLEEVEAILSSDLPSSSATEGRSTDGPMHRASAPAFIVIEE